MKLYTKNGSKQLSLIVFSLVLVMFSMEACNKDDKENSPSFSGRYRVVRQETSICTDAANNKVYECGSNAQYQFCVDYEFKANNSCTVHYSNSGTFETTYVVVGSKITFLYTSSSTMDEFTFSFSGSTLVLSKAPSSTSGCVSKYTCEKQ